MVGRHAKPTRQHDRVRGGGFSVSRRAAGISIRLLLFARERPYGNHPVLLYLDLNCLNRPFDEQSQDRIVRETAAVLVILQRIVEGVDQLVWSAILAFENAQHPLVDRRTEIGRWAQRAVVNVAITPQVSTRARALTAAGFRPLDAAHLACAEAAACDRLLTCDDQVLRRVRRVHVAVRVQNPTDYRQEWRDA